MELYIPIVLLVFFIGGLIALNKEVVKRPTFRETDKRYKEVKVCDEIHRGVTEKLECLPEIKKSVTQIETKIDIFLRKNGVK